MKSEGHCRARVSVFNANISDSLSDKSLNESDSIIRTEKVTISMKKTAFQKFAKIKNYKQRKVMKLEPGVWQNEISERLWNATKLKCGFNFKNLSAGSAKGMHVL